MIYSMFVLSLLTISIGLIAVKARVVNVKNGTLNASYFGLMVGEEVPEEVIKTTRCFNNLFEVPVLYYVVCTLYIVLELESFLALVIAWLFVVVRFFQAFIHITYNKVPHRMLAFGVSVLCVFFLWVGLIVSTL